MRYKGAGKAVVKRPDQKELRGRLNDISHSGAGLLLPVALELGEQIAFSVMTPRLERIELSGEVIHTQPQKNGQFVVGVKLDDWLKPEKLEELRSMSG